MLLNFNSGPTSFCKSQQNILLPLLLIYQRKASFFFHFPQSLHFLAYLIPIYVSCPPSLLCFTGIASKNTSKMPSPLPPPPPPPPPAPNQTTTSTSLNQIVIPKQPMKQQITLAPEIPHVSTRKVIEQPIIRRQPRRTNPVVWCGAILCMIFSILLIFFGVATLVVVLVIKPKHPVFDTPAARLNLIYFDTPVNFNGDFTFLANFSNPSRKLDVRFEYGDVELYFYDSLIASQAFQPFTLRRGEARLASVHMISSLVFLPPNLALELQQHVQSNRVIYNIRGTFRVRANLGLIHFSYWLHGRCQLEMTSPPIGALLARSCRTKR